MVLTFLSLQRFSEEAWEGLEKPLGTFRTETFAECGEKCSGLDGCGMMHFNRHDNRGYKWCTPAKVVSFTSCFTVTVFNVYILRLAASNQTIRSARRSPAMATFLVREISLSTCLLKFHSVSHLWSLMTLILICHLLKGPTVEPPKTIINTEGLSYSTYCSGRI